MSTLSRLVGRRRPKVGSSASTAGRRGRRPGWALEGIEQQLFDHSPVAVVVTDQDDRILAVNDAYTRLTGYSQEEAQGQHITFNHLAQDEASGAEMRADLAESGRWVGEFHLRNRNGESLADAVTRMALHASNGKLLGYLTVSTDLQATDDGRRAMLWQAHYDPLTKLPNRNLFEQQLSELLCNQRSDLQGALLSIDLDRFQMVNDSVGPSRADQLLTELAYRLAMCVGETHTLARLAGDHFVLLMSEVRDRAEVEQLGRSILTAIQQPFHVEARELFIRGSVGVALLPQHGSDTGELLQKADAARIQAKQQGGNSLAFFDPEMNARAERRLELESALRRAVAGEQLMLYYQPVVDVKRSVISSAEALLRWQHPELGLVSPAEFIPVAEDMGLIVEIGEWVVKECRRQLHDWRRRGATDLRISLNVSPVQLRREQDVQSLLALLQGEGDDNGLILELTESALMENSERVHRYLEQARRVGSMVALDDFGTGFSSLGYLRYFEFDVLKIDKSFIDELANARDYGLVASIVSMGRILGMRVVAEGVETADQVKRLRQIGCDYVQGYYFSRPLPAEEFYCFLQNGIRQAG
ncbi:MAG: putative bifunctional diguanylate cyclase/phosphodiesterase [Pseudomonadales bacterium]